MSNELEPNRGKSLTRGFLGRLRHPWLFAIAAVVLVVDLFVPDAIPLADEILLAATTAVLGLLRRRRSEATTEPSEADPAEPD